MPSKIHKDQKGMAHLFGILALITVIVMVSVVGYRIYQRRDTATVNKKSRAPEPVFQNPKNLAQAHNAFGFNLIRDLNHDHHDNLFISPTSIALALSMVYNGANGETQQGMAQTMQVQSLDMSQLNQESLGLIKQLKNPDEGVELAIANSVWARKGVSFKPGFLKIVEDYYLAQSKVLDFTDPKAPEQINSWVSDNTHGKILSIVDKIPSDMVMYLINATYFKGTWTTSFDKKLTEDKSFTPGSGPPKQLPLMRQKNELSYYANDDFQSVSLPYGKNKQLSMYVFLPKNLQQFTDSLDLSKWNQWMSQYKSTEGTILLPKFKLEYEAGLNDVLTKLGMGVAFSEKADFSAIGSNLKISQVKHKTYVDVNEEGTEAAAVTSIGVEITSVQPDKKTFYMEVNKPFFFAIVDNKSGEILFLGVMHNP